jgi:lipoate-protein ligase A
MEKNWRLILDDKYDGYYNMAVDEAILLNYFQKKVPTLRIYSWQAPFISLGYHQTADCVLTFKKNIPFVRRITGGSAILHYKELTYSITCSLADLNLPYKVKDCYRTLNSFLIKFYAQLGLEAKFAGEVNYSPYDKAEPLSLGEYSNFCYACRQYFDVVIGNKKIGGNAQRRKKNIIFQQGSIPQEIDFALVRTVVRGVVNLETKATSLNEILNIETDFYDLGRILMNSFRHNFGINLIREELSKEELLKRDYLIHNKYIREKWNSSYKPQQYCKASGGGH